jgi:hypothetical protein
MQCIGTLPGVLQCNARSVLDNASCMACLSAHHTSCVPQVEQILSHVSARTYEPAVGASEELPRGMHALHLARREDEPWTTVSIVLHLVIEQRAGCYGASQLRCLPTLDAGSIECSYTSSESVRYYLKKKHGAGHLTGCNCAGGSR